MLSFYLAAIRWPSFAPLIFLLVDSNFYSFFSFLPLFLLFSLFHGFHLFFFFFVCYHIRYIIFPFLPLFLFSKKVETEVFFFGWW